MSLNKEQLNKRRSELMSDISPLAEKVKKKEQLTDAEKADLAQMKSELAEVDETLELIKKNEELEAKNKELSEANDELSDKVKSSIGENRVLKPSEINFKYEIEDKDKKGVHVLLHAGKYADEDGRPAGETFIKIFNQNEASSISRGLIRYPFSIEKILYDPYGELTAAFEKHKLKESAETKKN